MESGVLEDEENKGEKQVGNRVKWWEEQNNNNNRRGYGGRGRLYIYVLG